jgi:hypothetical protein
MRRVIQDNVLRLQRCGKPTEAAKLARVLQGG